LTPPEQQLIEREPALRVQTLRDASIETAARASLREQIARLEHELSRIVAAGFPHIAPAPPAAAQSAGPALLGLAELERSRDALAARVQQATKRAAARADRQRRARELLEGMKLEPGRYRYLRLPVSELGEGGCGVWEVRPRLGLIGMLAGWWQLKLSSGCPLPRGSRSMRGPGHWSAASPPACGADARS
jgi:hypothetical protein